MARTSIVVTHNSSMKKHHIYQIHTELHNYNYRYTTSTSILCGNIRSPKLPKLPTYIYIYLYSSLGLPRNGKVVAVGQGLLCWLLLLGSNGNMA